MKIINLDDSFRILKGNKLSVLDKLPASTYMVNFSPMQGFWLTKEDDFTTGVKKVYGNQMERIDKILKNYEDRDRSLGTLLSGTKGMGKTLFARMLAKEVLKKDMPVIIVPHNFPGILDFIGSIKQSVMILMDEFEKNFPRNDSDDGDSQEDMLSLLDGTDQTKRLYVVTANDLGAINQYLLNRPGRFYYHFRFNYPTPEEVKALLQDFIKPQYAKEIGEIEQFSNSISLNYDSLIAIAEEVNRGYAVKETIGDLNIQADGATERYTATVFFKNGQKLTDDVASDNDDMYLNIRINSTVNRPFVGISIKPYTGVSGENGKLEFDGSNIDSVKYDDTYYYDDDDKRVDKDMDGFKVKKVELTRKVRDSWSYDRYL